MSGTGVAWQKARAATQSAAISLCCLLYAGDVEGTLEEAMKFRAEALDSADLVIKPGARRWEKFKANVENENAKQEASKKRKGKGKVADDQNKIAKFFAPTK